MGCVRPGPLLVAAARGTHLLFDNGTIAAAFAQDPLLLREIVDRRGDELEEAVEIVLALPSADDARRFIAGLPAEIQHLLVVLYFELIDALTPPVGHTLH